MRRSTSTVDAGLLGDLAADAVFEGLVEFEDAAGRLPLGGVAALDGEDAAVVAHDDAGDADGVVRGVGHLGCLTVARDDYSIA